MPEVAFNSETLKAVLTLVILAAALYGFVSERLAPDVTALLALLALLLTGVLTPAEAFSGFSHPATISVAAVLVLSAAIERTGALTFLARRLLTPLGKAELLFTVAIMLVISVLSAFVNNTAAVAVFIPVVVEACRRSGASPGRVLMPMSHAATFGGMCTLIGTSTNLVAHEFALSQGLPGFSMFELGKVGLPMLFAGYAYILLVGRRFLPRNQIGDLLTVESAGHYLAELTVKDGGAWDGRPVRAENFPRDFDVELIGLMREGRAVETGEASASFASRDSLLVRGLLEQVLLLAAQEGLELHRPTGLTSDATPETQDSSPAGAVTEASTSPADSAPTVDDQTTPPSITPDKPMLAEVVVLTTSGLIGRTLKDARFAERYDAIVLALRRRGDLRERPSTTPLHAGDMLVVEGESEALKALADTQGFLVVGTPSHPEERPGKLFITILTLVAVIISVSLGLLPIVTAATAGCAVLMLTGCLRPREVYQAIDLSLVFLLAGSLALGVALDKTGVTDVLAAWLTGLTGVTGPFVVMAGFFFVSVIVSELMSNSGTVALLGPVAISVATKMGVNPMALLAAVTFGASAAFAMPIGYQTSLMIYGPGGYRFRDFVKMGVALDLILAVLALLLIPYFWPLVTP
ncbi:MAG: SLC13 family permease [Pyrinomonadaceae bacterium]